MDSIIAVHEQVEQTPQYLRVIAEQAAEGIVVADLNGTIRFINTAWAAMHGYENTQGLIGKQISVFHSKEQMETDVIPFIEEVKRRGQLAGPVDHIRRNGTLLPTEMLMVVFKDRMGKVLGLIGFATDITEQQRTKDELKRYRNHLAELVEQQTGRLKAANEQLQREIAERKQAEKYIRQQIDELRTVNKQLQEQINELRVLSPITKTDMSKTTVSLKAVQSLAGDEKAILTNVFKENIALQKPELVNIAVDKSVE